MRALAGLLAKWLGVACSMVIWLATSAVARAEPGLTVLPKLTGVELGRSMALLEDEAGALQLADVLRPEVARRFRVAEHDAPHLGFTRSVYWVRLNVANPSARTLPWLLELSYPHLDDITLYAPEGEHYTARRTGDYHPFASRDVAHRAFVFSLEEPPGTTHTYYLRVQTTSSMSLAMRAWDNASFLGNQPRDMGLWFLFYGTLLVMALYNLCMWVLIRQVEHLSYLFFILSTGLLQLTLSGHLAQFFLPDAPRLLDQAMPLSAALALASGCFVGVAYLEMLGLLLPIQRTIKRAGFALLLTGPAIAPLPYALRMQLLMATFVMLSVLTLAPAMVMLRANVLRARIYIAAWACVIAGFMIACARVTGLVPSNMLTEWAGQLGNSLQLVLLASALADRINAMRRDLGTLNGELSRKVELLEDALLSAENATARAEQATRVKDEFMATMSHELRTPLNAIINVPQGLLRDFPRAEAVHCARCDSTFELEQGEKVTRNTPCPECASVGSLQPAPLFKYRGKPEHTARYLQMIERSGHHLLQMVNGVLDFSKLELGRLELVLESFDVCELVREIGDEMELYAERAGIRLELSLPPSEQLVADPMRLRQVLLNLLSNAVKFSEPGSTVEVGLLSKPDRVELYVRDRGIGIAPEHFERIFASFEQVHRGNTRKYGGSGLGLSISRSLVRMHGGELWVQSELGQGSTFTCRIPRGLSGGRSRNASSRLKSVTVAGAPRHGEEMAS